MELSILSTKWLAALAFALTAGWSGADERQPRFDPKTLTVLAGDRVETRLVGLEPKTRVTVTAERSYNGRLYRSVATYESGSDGTLELAEAQPITAPWEGVDPRGHFWSMRDTGEPAPESWRWKQVHFGADVDGDGETDCSGFVTLDRGSDDLREIPLGPEFPGAFLLRRADSERQPAIIVLGGSEGGDRGARLTAPKLAARGFAVVGLPYYSPAYYGREPQIPELPRAFHDIPLDRLEAARDWLRARDDIDEHRIALYGVSKGAEFVLAGASRIEGFKAVVAIAPTDVIWEGWGPGTVDGKDSSFSWRGEPLPFVPYIGMSAEIAKYSTGEPVHLRTPHDEGRKAHPDRVAAARIAVEAIDEPVFLVGGDADEVWDSGGMASAIVEAREAAGLVTVAYVGAESSHSLSGDGYTPLSAADARLQGRAFPAMLEFLRRHLALDQAPDTRR